MKNHRSSKSGKFVSKDFARENEDTTVSETRPKKPELSPLEMALAVETKGLFHISETDAPFKLIERQGLPFGRAETVPFDEFFENLTLRRDWFSEDEINRSIRFINLKALLERSLYDLTVVKVAVNAAERLIFIFGKDETGKTVGLETVEVST